MTPFNISDTTRTSGGQAVYTVNVYNSTAINQFDVRITYNYSIIHVASIDYTSNVLGSGAQILYNCLDGVTPPGACDTLDGAGVLHLSLYILGNVSVTPPPVGVLLKVTFNIVGQGLTQLHLIPGGSFGSDLLLGSRNIPLTARDAYFNNIRCGTVLCKPPVVDFTFSPTG
jgi:hypothetical protein